MKIGYNKKQKIQERALLMRKFGITLLFVFIITINAYADNWKEGFSARLMKLMTAAPECTDLILTDIDCNGIPEAFLLQKNTRLITGITQKGGNIVSLSVPENISGMCLTDITVYDTGAGYVCIGKEVNEKKIDYFKLILNENMLICEEASKADYSCYPAVAYTDTYTEELFENGYPDRRRINEFLNNYETPKAFVIKPTNAILSIDGDNINASGFNINGSNYYRIRDIARLLGKTASKFDVVWNEKEEKIEINRGADYSPSKNEIYYKVAYYEVEKTDVLILEDGSNLMVEGYNIDGSTYLKIRDIGELAGFETAWDAKNKTILIITD